MTYLTSWSIRKRGLALVFALPSCALAMPAPTIALADMSLEELSGLQVTSASKRAEPLSDAATALFVITADDIRRSGATNLPEALRLAPNLNLAQINNNGYSVSARGFSGTSSNKLLVLIDGRSVYTPLFAGVFWDVQDVMLEDIERIEVISGPGGTLWGVNAVNGVINVITRSSSDTQGGLLTGTYGNRGHQASARYGGMLGNASEPVPDDAGSYRVYARHVSQYHTELANGHEVNDAGQLNQAGMRADWRGASSRLMVEGQLYDGDHGQPLPGSIAISGLNFALGPIDVKGGHILGNWTHQLGGGDEINVQAYVDHTERVVPPTFSEKLDISDVQFQYMPLRSERQAWVLGGQYRLGQDRLRNSTYFGFLPADVNQTWTSLFAQDEITLHERLKLTLGTRLESNDYTGAEWLPNARLAWKLAPDHMLWTALSRTVRAPSRLDRDPYIPNFRAPSPPYLLAGGPDVEAEVARVFEIGYRGQPSANTSLSVNWYRSLYDKLHTQELSATRNYIIYAGRMRAAIDGLEAWGSYQPMPAWRLSAGFSGLYQRFALAPDSVDRAGLAAARGKDPAQTWQVRSSWDGPHGHEFDATLRHVSVLRSPDIPSYFALDLRWGWQVRRDLALSLTGRNLMSAGHAEYASTTTNTIATRSELGPGVSLQVTMWF
jgi:iron complex outermembrane receptor protein